MKTLIKSLLALTPYRIVSRGKQNRFQAIEESLRSLAGRGFRPALVIDGGANTGDFTRMALRVFPQTRVHAIEPQPGCEPDLRKLATQFPDQVVVHVAALGPPEKNGTILTMEAGETTTSTGAHVVTEGTGLAVACRSLDSLIIEAPGAGAQAGGMLLKLDLQGFELEALKGATETLKSTDAILTEVSFYAQAYEPPISALTSFLAGHGFELYDVASIYARPRDDRPRQGDFVFVRSGSPLAADKGWS